MTARWVAGLGVAVCSLLGAPGCGSGRRAQQPVLVEAGSRPSASRQAAPDWVLRTPYMKGKICAVGAVDPTFYRQDGRTQASDAARNELARTVQVKIGSIMYDEQTVHGTFVDQATVQEVVGSISEVVLSGAQVMEVWFDATGSVSRKGMTYALACMPTDQSVAELADRLQQVASSTTAGAASDRIARVKENARKAFDDLEAMENKQSKDEEAAPAAAASDSSDGTDIEGGSK